VTTFPAVEKICSKLTDVAGIDKYFFAKSATKGYFFRVTSTIQMDQNCTSVAVLLGNNDIVSKHPIQR